MKKLNLHYIAGLIDADGSFSISLSDRRYKNNALAIGVTVNLRQLQQYESVLTDVMNTLGRGSIYRHVENMMTWQTTSIGDAIYVAKTLYPYLKIKKQICKNFFTILEEWNRKKYVRKDGRRRNSQRRPKVLIEKLMDVALNLNRCQQTKTAYENKKKRVEALRLKINQFYH